MHLSKPEKKTQINKRTRKPHLFKKALCLVSILSLIAIQAGVILRPVQVFGEAVPDVPESHPEDAASFILTLMMGMGCGVANASVIQSLYQQLGNVNITTATVEQINQGLSNVKAAVNFDFSTIFSSTASQAGDYINSVGADKVVHIGGTAASATDATAGQNLVASFQNYLNNGIMYPAVGALTFVGTEVLPATLAVGAGVALGFAIDRARTSLLQYIQSGQPVTIDPSIISAAGSRNVVLRKGANSGYEYPYFVYPFGWECVAYKTNDSYNRIGVLGRNFNSSSGKMGVIKRNLSTYGDSTTVGGNSTGKTSAYASSSYPLLTVYNDEASARAYLNSLTVGKGKQNISPDIIGPNGNQTKEVPSGDDLGLPYINPTFDPTTETMRPIPREVLESWVEDANTNTNNDDQQQQQQDFETATDPYIQPIGDPSPDPDPDPNPNPYPTIVPVPSVVPDPQPTAAPLPDPTQEEIDNLPEGITQPDWKEKFPFCIPYDILSMMNLLNAGREAPYLEFDLSFGPYNGGTVVIDLSPFDAAAQLLRLLQTILFIVGLAMATHKLLNPSGGV